MDSSGNASSQAPIPTLVIHGQCRVMGYCSKEVHNVCCLPYNHNLTYCSHSARRRTGPYCFHSCCDHRDRPRYKPRKTHKPICQQMSSKTATPSRPPSIKVAERISADEDVMCRIDGMLIKALDLEHHPENAESNAVIISCRVESVDMKMAKERLMHLLAGREPPPLPEKVPKLFQIGKVVLLPNKSVPDTLNVTAQRTKEMMQGVGLFQPGSGHILVRGAWVSEECDWATCYFARCITPEMIQEASRWKRSPEEGEPPSVEPMTLDYLIK